MFVSSGLLFVLVAASASVVSAQVTIGFSQASYAVMEGENVVVTVTATGTFDSGTVVAVIASTVDGTAVAPEDYSSDSMFQESFTAPGSANVTISTTEDALFEGNQTFSVNLVLDEMQTTFNGSVTISPNSTMVVIQDNDAVTMGFSRTSYSVVEGEMVEVCVNLISGTLQQTLTVDIVAAAAMADEISGLGSVMFNSGEMAGAMRCINVMATADGVLEAASENVTLVLTSSEGVMFNPMYASLMISMPTVSLVGDPMRTVQESDSSLTVCFMISPTPGINVTVNVATTNGSATAGMDYVAVSMPLVFPSGGADQQCVDVMIVDDDALESAETFQVAVAAINNNVIIVNGILTVTIATDDNEVLTVSVPGVVVAMEGEMLSVCLNASSPAGGLQRDVVVMVETQDGSALANVDYDPVNTMLTFTSGDVFMQMCVSINVTVDDVLENDEAFLVVVTSMDPAVRFTSNVTMVNIVTNGAVTFGFAMATASVDEGESVAVCVDLTSGQLAIALTLGVMADPDGVATVPASLTFPANSTQQCFLVMVPFSLELAMDLALNLSLTTGDAHAITLQPNTIILNIRVLTIGLEMERYSVEEGGALEVCAVIMSGYTPESDVAVTISTMDGSAKANMDYTPLNNVMLTFGPGNNSRQCASINTTDDAVFRGNRTFDVMLQAVDMERVSLAMDSSTAQVTITDNDMVTIGFNSDPQLTVVEGNSISVEFGVLAGSLGTVVTITIMSMDSGATAGLDYTAVNEDRTLNSSVPTQNVDIMTAPDEVFTENSEMFSLRLTSTLSPPLVTVNPDTVTITIIDAPFISQHPVGVFALPGENVSFTVMASGFNISYQWLFNGVALEEGPDVMGTATSTLTLNNVTTENLGMYRCRVSNLVANITSNEAELQFLTQPPMLFNVTGDSGVLLGNTITLSCTAISPDGVVSITWTTDSTVQLPMPVETRSTEGVLTSTLTLPSVTMAFDGIYTCTANNRLFSVAEMLSLYVITITGVQDVLATVGTNATLFCEATGHEDLTYFWQRVGRGSTGDAVFIDFLSETAVVGRNSNMLTFLSVSRRDTDEYGCMVSLFGTLIGSAFGNLTTRGPMIIENPMDVTLTMNDTLILNCTAVNNADAPNPLSFEWVHNSFRLLNPMTQEIVVDNRTVTSQLIVPNVQRENAGMYECKVHNRAPIDEERSTVAVVTVNFAPVILLALDGEAGSVFNVTNGNNIEISCSADAVPSSESLSVFIVFNGTRRLLGASNGSEVRDNSTVLTLLENGTVVTCEATNSIGMSSASTIVVVQDVPEMVNHNDISANIVDLLRVDLMWTVPEDNNSPITSFNISSCALDTLGICRGPSNEIVPPPSSVQPGARVSIRAMYPVNSFINVRITAINSIGMSMASEGGYNFSTATQEDAAPVDPTQVLLTTSSAVYRWLTSPRGRGEGIMLEHYNVTFSPAGSGRPPQVVMVTQDQGEDTFGAGVSGLLGGLFHNVSVIAVFSTPSIISEPLLFNFTTPQADMPLLNAGGGTQINSATVTAINWPIPDPTFLTGYTIRVTTVSRVPSQGRRKRQTPQQQDFPVTDPTQTSFDLMTQPFSDISAQVLANYDPDGSQPIMVPLIDPLTFSTPEGAASPPRQLTLIPLGFNGFQITWQLPEQQNGIISDHLIIYQNLNTSGGTVSIRTESAGTGHELLELVAHTQYRVLVSSLTGPDGSIDGEQAVQTGFTDFGVSPPTVNRFRTSISAQFTLSIGLSTSFGPIDFYQVVVTTSNQIARSGINTSPNAPASPDYYVAFQGDYPGSSPQVQFQSDLGTGSSVRHRGVVYNNSMLQANTDYFVFIRAFSAVDQTVFSDSEFSELIRFSVGGTGSSVNTVAIIVPIAIVALILLIILVVLLVFAYCTMQGTFRRRGYSPKGTVLLEDGKRRNKGSAAMELRRTRLFSPVLNVGSPDVFTSAGQPTTLICEASGTPAPEVTWTHNDLPLDKERFIQLADGSLFINDTDLQDEGTYVVQATNLAGDAEVSVRMTVLRPIPPESDTDHAPIKVGEFSEKIALVRAEDDEGLEDEYADVDLDWTFSTYSAKLNINKNKNRYINIIPYDHARVVLSLQDNTPGSDYINASFIDAYQRPNGYIASQGPIPSTFPDFWRMIWELDAPTIVMVTNLKEEDKIKCHQYWPSYGTTTYGNIQVTLKEVENLAEYSIRTFNVSPLAGQSRVPMPVREVRQFHFLVWPDHGVPQYATNLLSFRKRVLNYHPDKRGPMVVHCSAGVGRTGTFITIDYMLKQMEAEGTIDIFNYVRHMRYRRNYMVQTSPQYVFIHDALLEAIMCGDNSIKAPELRAKVKEMQAVLSETGKTTFETQFNTLMSASPPDDDFDCSIAQLPDNMSKNRSKTHLPANDYRVVLSTDGDQSDYICASYVDNYRERNAFIVTQAPMSSTVNDFWRMMWETKSAAIVMLTELTEGDQEMCVKYWPSGVGDPSVYGGFQVELSEDEKDRGSYITRRFKLSPLDKPQESRMVSQFHFTKWTKTTPPVDCHPIIDLIDELQRVQRKSGNMPITVHCDDGISRTGAFCALYSVLERVKTEQIVDVFQAIKTLRIQRAGLLGTIEEYEFVHRAVIEFLDTFSDYQNFK